MLITLIGLIAYANTFTISSYQFDDTTNIIVGNAVRNSGTLHDLFNFSAPRALGQISFALNYRLHADSVPLFHVTNFLIHLLTALCLASLVSVTFRTPLAAAPGSEEQRPSLSWLAGLLAALLFITHPVQTQAVTYLVQRFSSLATLFYLAAVLCYARGRLALDAGAAPRVIAWMGGALLSMLLAMKTKEIAFTLPFAILLYEFCFFRGQKLFRIVMAGALTGALVIIPFSIFGSGIFTKLPEALSRLKVQTTMDRSEYFFSQLPVIIKYLRLIILPVGQNVEHQAVHYTTLAAWPVLSAGLFLSIALLAGFMLILRGRKRSPLLIFSGFGIVWFFLALSVESSFIPIVDLMFEHRLYLPFAGLCMAVAVPVARMAELRRKPDMFVAGAGVLILLLAGTTAVRNEVWRTPVSLWQDATAKSPGSSRAWNNLAYAYLKEKKPDMALPALVRSIELNANFPDVWNNIGIALDQLGRYQGRYHRIFTNYENSTDLARSQTVWFANVSNALGLAHEHLGQPAAAIQSYKKALSMKPDLAVARYNLAVAALAMGNIGAAEKEYEQLKTLAPQFAAQLEGMLGR